MANPEDGLSSSSAIALPGSSGQFPEWLTFDVSDPKVLRGDHKGTPLRVLGAPLGPAHPGRHSWPTARRQGHPRSRRHSSRRTRRPLRRPSASLRSFQKATHTLGPTSPLQLTLLQDLPRAPLGDYRQGYLSSCRLKATICLLGDTLLGFLSPSGSLLRTPLGLEGYSLVPRSLGPSL